MTLEIWNSKLKLPSSRATTYLKMSSIGSLVKGFRWGHLHFREPLSLGPQGVKRVRRFACPGQIISSITPLNFIKFALIVPELGGGGGGGLAGAIAFTIFTKEGD